MTRPLVSVCVPTRNHGRWLPEALESVFHQTLEDLEVIVADDASSDDTGAVMARQADPRLRYLRHSRRLGVAANRNACLDAARGRYVAWLDADDRYLPEMLEVQVGALESNPGALLAHGHFEVIDEEGRARAAWSAPFPADNVEAAADALGELALRNYVAAPTVVTPRRAHDLAGSYRTSLETGEDWDLWLRVALHGDFVYTARPVAQYRWHRGSLTRTAESSGASLRQDLRVIDGFFRRHGAGIDGGRCLEVRARSALAARAVRRATDFLTRGARRRSFGALLVACRARPRLMGSATAGRLALAVLRLDEYRWHRESRRLLGELADVLEGSRMAVSLREAIATDPTWEETLLRIAKTVDEVVPTDATSLFVDKWDPTLLHLTGRRGWHFPDRRTMPDGYPPDSATAVRHLEELRSRGADYLVFPHASLWWLEHYPGLARHLERAAEPVCETDSCLIYRLGARESDLTGMGERWQGRSS